MRNVALCLALLISAPASAQWLHHPAPGIPRTKDGKPDLKAPPPRTRDGRPDLSGQWHRSADRYYNNIAADLKPGDVRAWADALYQQRRLGFGKDSMEVRCLPFGPAAATTPFRDLKIVQTASLILILLDDLTYRQIHMDGRALPTNPNPSWMGYSVGHWERDTLVVESTGFTEGVWLDYDGHPHTEALRMTERFRRRDFGHLDLSVTLDDPGAYAKPWTVQVPLDLQPDTELLEMVCRENEKDHARMSNDTAVTVPAGTLARYVGRYEIRKKDYARPVVISLSGGSLFLDIDDTGPQQLVPLSSTNFSYSGTVVQFVPDANGVVTRLLIEFVEGQDVAYPSASYPPR